MVRVLAELGADQQARDDKGWLPIHKAVESGHVAVVRVLVTLDKKNKEARTAAGSTALHLAAYNGQVRFREKQANRVPWKRRVKRRVSSFH